MKLELDGKEILERVAKVKNDRGRVTLYLSKGLYKQFQEKCDEADASASLVLEELIKAFVQSTSEKDKKRVR